jgi:hypothetical protein
VRRSGVAPKLVGFLANADPAARKCAWPLALDVEVIITPPCIFH